MKRLLNWFSRLLKFKQPDKDRDLQKQVSQVLFFQLGESRLQLKVSANDTIAAALAQYKGKLPSPPSLYMTESNYKDWLLSIVPECDNKLALVVKVHVSASQQARFEPSVLFEDLVCVIRRLKINYQADSEIQSQLTFLMRKIDYLSTEADKLKPNQLHILNALLLQCNADLESNIGLHGLAGRKNQIVKICEDLA